MTDEIINHNENVYKIRGVYVISNPSVSQYGRRKTTLHLGNHFHDSKSISVTEIKKKINKKNQN